MEREELLNLVNAELGENRLTLSERTINEELDDVLGDFGDDEAANTAIVSRVASRLKRMDGNLHADVSAEVKRYRERNKPSVPPANTGEEPSKDTVTAETMRKLLERIEGLEKHNEEQAKSVARQRVSSDVHSALKQKLEKAGFTTNDYFMKAALAKLQISDEDNDIPSLVDKAERLYNADMKEAGFDPEATPRFGGGVGTGGNNAAARYFAQKAKKEGWNTK